MTSQKLYSFIEKHEFEIQKIISTPSSLYLELLTKNKVDYILLKVSDSQISSPYPYPIVYFNNIKKCSPKKYKNEIEDYAYASDSFIEKTYSDSKYNIQIPTERYKIPMSLHLTETYKRPVVIDDKQKDERLIQYEISRQLNRLRYCVKGMTHKLAIYQNSYIGLLDEDENIETYQCDKNDLKHDIKLYIIIEFKIFYDRLNLIETDCSQIFKGIYSILTNNQKQHTNNLYKMMEQKEYMNKQIDTIYQRKNNYENYIEQYITLLEELHTYQFQKTTELQQIQSVKANALHNDMKRNNQIRKLEKELQEMNKSRNKLIQIITDMKNKYEQIILISDTILFDNIVLLDKIIKNFDKLKNLQFI